MKKIILIIKLIALSHITYSQNLNGKVLSDDKITPIIGANVFWENTYNPILSFYLHKYGAGQGRFSLDLSIDNGVSWILDFYNQFC